MVKQKERGKTMRIEENEYPSLETLTELAQYGCGLGSALIEMGKSSETGALGSLGEAVHDAFCSVLNFSDNMRILAEKIVDDDSDLMRVHLSAVCLDNHSKDFDTEREQSKFMLE